MLNPLSYLWSYINPVKLEVIKVNPHPFDGPEKFYEGGKAEIFLKVRNKYTDRIIEDIELDFECSFHVELKSYHFQKGCHVYTVDCHKKGRASLSFKSSNPHGQCQHGFDVVSPPLHPGNCCISRTEVGRVMVGQVVKWKLELYDICKHRFPLKDHRPGPICLKIEDVLQSDDKTCREKEKSSLKLTRAKDAYDSHVRFVEWQPLVAGRRSIALLINGIQIGKRSMEIDVQPGLLIEIVPVNNHSPSNNDQKLSYLNEKETAKFKGLDEFGNKVSINPSQWYLDVHDTERGLVLPNISGSCTDIKTLQFTYSFDKTGTYEMTVRSKIVHGKLNVPDPLVVKVTPAPLDPTKCTISVVRPIFEGRLNKVAVKLALFDCTSKPYTDKKLEKSSLQIKFDQKLTSLTKIDYTSANELIVFANFDNQEGLGKCNIEVKYNGNVLGKPIYEELVFIHPYKKRDYLRLPPEKPLKIICKNIPPRKIIGEDKVHMQNINRVMQIKFPKLSEEIEKEDIEAYNKASTILYLHKFEECTKEGYNLQAVKDKILGILSLIVEGSIHYRRQASQFDENREKWKAKAIDAYCSGEYEEARECKIIKEYYADLMNESHRKASDAIFKFFNCDRPECEVDLHGQLVANEDKLKAYRKQLSKKENTEEVERIINKERIQGDEAIRHLRQKIADLTPENRTDWLEVIVGAGHHSRNHHQNIRPKVEEFLKKQKDLPRFIEANEGALLITFTEYTGEEPCLANFYCKKCKKAWQSYSSWKDFWQLCFQCDRKNAVSQCYPFKLRPKSTSTSRKSRRVGGSSFTREDHIKLCQKCQLIGKYCESL